MVPVPVRVDQILRVSPRGNGESIDVVAHLSSGRTFNSNLPIGLAVKLQEHLHQALHRASQLRAASGST